MLAEQAKTTSRNETNRSALLLADSAKREPAIFLPALNPASKSGKQPTTLLSRCLFTFAHPHRRDQTPEAFIIWLGTFQGHSKLVSRPESRRMRKGQYHETVARSALRLKNGTRRLFNGGTWRESLTGRNTYPRVTIVVGLSTPRYRSVLCPLAASH